MNKAEETVKAQHAKAKHWYSGLVGESKTEITEAQIFIVSFIAGLAIGIASSK